MYITSMVLDGFKSYCNRMEITGFDPEFNAITGLNGTGKSNIFDAICFVLGITNLSNVRVGSLQELIYKQGQAGVTKATVSITFNNRNKAQSPIGYENQDEITVTRQLVMGGKNKYLINGINVQNKRVIDLFCSVQLNVNNPHFLIMQGRITKVLNMKPVEILSMLEEAAGTRMYESKKQVALKIIEKKDAKLRELNSIITEDIEPQLQKLQDERVQYQDYQKVVRELENLTRLYVAYKFVTLEENTKAVEDKLEAVQNDIQSKKDINKSNTREAEDLENQISELNRRLDEESGGALVELQGQRDALAEDEARLDSCHRAALDELRSHARRAELQRRDLDQDEAALQAKLAELNQLSESFESLRAASADKQAALAAAEERFLSVSTGNEGGSSHTLQDQLMAAQTEASEAYIRISQSTLEKGYAQDRLKVLEREFRSSSEQFQRDQDNIVRQQAEVDRLQEELARLSYSAERHAELRRDARTRHADARALRDQVDALAPRLQRCNFTYTPPHPSFNRSAVYGTVGRLLDVTDPLYCVALDTTAGGRLYDVVVDTEVTSRQLLQRGQLASRVTIIPLNKIRAHCIERDVVRLAQTVAGGPENVQLALDLVTFEEHLRPAMAWVFGSTLVCRDADTANRVTFHPRIQCRSVTLDGDVYDPKGSLSGGAPVRGGSVLAQLQELRRLEARLAAADEARARDAAELAALLALHDEHSTARERAESAARELEGVRARLAASRTAELHAEIQSLRAEVTALTEAIERDEETRRQTTVRARDLEERVKDIKGHRERNFKIAAAALKKAKKDAELHGKAWTDKQQQLEMLQLEVQALEAAIAARRPQLGEEAQEAARLQAAADGAQRDLAAAAGALKDIVARIRAKRADIASRSGEVAALERRRERFAADAAAAGLAAKELGYRLKGLQAEAADASRKMEALVSEHAWIPGEREHFGAAGGLYDFEGRQASVAGQRVAQLAERKERLARGLNARAHTLLGKEEDQYQDLLRKRAIVQADRAKLVQVMAELDEKKRETLLQACERVNADFGSIYSSLLPGVQARLAPPRGLTVLDGLEIQVAFSGVWRASLDELSGGQRSLVALSLVLAMLLCKPAPLYILDEVDAALDLSHTQNIGSMLRNHFRHSQFIIVSLKDGMFNNANVLFRTEFVDGMSVVQRQAGQHQHRVEDPAR